MTALQDQSWFGSWEGRPPDVLWSSGDYLYCRLSRDPAEGAERELIVVVPSAEHPTPSIVNRLVHEFALKEHLDSSWAVRPLELIRERGRTMLVLENVMARPLEQIAGAPLDIEWFLRLAIDASSAVTRLHPGGLVHKDITAGNILVDRATGEVRLTGFGIASRLARERQAPEAPELIAGTLSHMAPEQTGRMNRSIDSRSDLYSLGVTLYQALAWKAITGACGQRRMKIAARRSPCHCRAPPNHSSFVSNEAAARSKSQVAPRAGRPDHVGRDAEPAWRRLGRTRKPRRTH